MMNSKTIEAPSKQLLAVLFVFLFSTYAYFNQGWGWNQNSRLALLHSIVQEQRLIIDTYHHHTGDKSQIGDHYVSDKGPGVVLLAFPAFTISAAIVHVFGIDIDQGKGWQITEWAATAGSLGILLSIAGTFLFYLLSKRVGQVGALISVLGIFLGSLTLPYATMLFAHGASIALLSLSIALILYADTQKEKESLITLAGFCAALAVTGEYPAALGAGSLLLFVAAKDWRSAGHFIIGTLPAIALLFSYNMATFGSITSIGYSHLEGFEEMKSGFFGIHPPKISVAFTILFSEHRGLFFWSPVLWLIFPGYIDLYKKDRNLFILCAAVPCLFLSMAAGYVFWDGGFAFGPRHLSAALPFLLIPLAHGCKKYPVAGIALAVVSIALTTLATALDAQPPNEYLHPLSEFYFSEIAKGHVEANLGWAAGIPGYWSLLPLMGVWLTCGILLYTKIFPQKKSFIAKIKSLRQH